MKHWLMAAAALAAAPAFAQVSPPPLAPAAALAAAEPVDPARLAAARTTVDHIWPIGTYERMMKGSMDKIMDNVMASMFDMRVGDLDAGRAPDGKKLKPAEANMTLREAMAKADPHFQERMRISNRVMMAEMLPVMNRLEPDIRAGLARAYARKFSVEQLGEMNRFFASPVGAAYARESMTMWMDPEIAAAVAGFAPELVKEMPRIMAKVQAATAHLPPPPAPARRR
jgi:hypothetical protein